ncbi:hypothetical protein [Paraoerskovia marina]|uniref:hypothetical protein n=1 Tax=Paraoerskovia marina TaxID=545619 RepID=UPI000492549A|nr:hypothetical protein [Paraoerskovia marina]
MKRIVASVGVLAALTAVSGCSEQIDLAAFCTSGGGMASAFSDVDPSDIGATGEALGALATDLRSVEAPEEIAADVETVAGGFESASESFASLVDMDPADPDYVETALAASEGLQSDDFNAAAERIEDYTAENCS